MKKSEWEYLAKVMWTFADSNNGRISPLVKELIIKLNENIGVIVNELDESKQVATSNRQEKTNRTGKSDFKGNGEF